MWKMMDRVEMKGPISLSIDYYKLCQNFLNFTIKIMVFIENTIFSIITLTFRAKKVYNFSKRVYILYGCRISYAGIYEFRKR